MLLGRPAVVLRILTAALGLVSDGLGLRRGPAAGALGSFDIVWQRTRHAGSAGVL